MWGTDIKCSFQELSSTRWSLFYVLGYFVIVEWFFSNVILFASFLRERPWNYSYRGYFALAYCQICRHVNTYFLKKNLSSNYITRNCEINGVQYYQYDTNGRNMFFDLQRKPSLLLLKHSIWLNKSGYLWFSYRELK